MVAVGRGHDPPTEVGDATASSGGGLVGRQREVTALQEALDEVVSGHGRLILLSGEPGIGKTRLADELSGRAEEHGATVLWGRCWEAGGAPAYWPWVQAIRAYLEGVDETALRRQIGPGAADVAQLLPELGELLPEVRAAPSGDPDAARFRLFDAVTGFLSRAAHERPIVLIIDDLHAADLPSLLLLEFFAATLSKSTMLVIGTYRDVEIDRDHPLTPTLARFARLPLTRRIHLRGLEQSDVARYVEVVTGVRPAADIAAAIHRETEGNPLFLGEVARLAAAEGRLDDADATYWERAIPQGVREVIWLRVNRLSKECSRTLSLASVLGREFSVEPLEQISGLTRDELEEVIDEATSARVVNAVPGSHGRLRFGHALMRDTLYDELPPSRRARLHARAGEALEVLYRSDPDPHLAELAHHFFEAGRDGSGGRAVEYARRAGEHALLQLAYEESVRLYRMALGALDQQEPVDEAARLELLMSLGDAAMRAGDAQAGRDSFIAAASAARRIGASELFARAALGYGGRFVWARAADDLHLVAFLEEALRGLGEKASPVRARLMARLSGALRNERAREPRATLSAQAVELARHLGDPGTLAYTLDGRYAAIWAPDTTAERLAIADEIVALADEIGDEERALQGHHYRLSVFLETGDMAAMKRELETNLRAAEALHQPALGWYVAEVVALLALFEGRLDEADVLIDRAFDLGRRAESTHARVTHQMQRYALRREQGRAAEIEATLTAMMDDCWFYPWLRAAAVHLRAELGRTAEAKREFEACAADDFTDWPLDNAWLLGLTLFADVCTFLADERRAAALYTLLAPYECRNAFGYPEFSTGSVARSLGNLASTMGRFDDAERHFATALDANTRMGARPWVAHTHHDLGQMLLKRNDRGDREHAIEALQQAAAIAKTLGHVALEHKAATCLSGLAEGRHRPAADVSHSVEPMPRAPSVFRREGDYWLIEFEGRQVRLHDSKGLAYLAALLARPGREVHALDLVSTPGHSRAKPHSTSGIDVSDGRSAAGEILDERARRAYRERIEELQATIDESEQWNDPERAARAQDELDFLVRELSAATGLGGRDRRTNSDAERARVNATRAIRSAIERIRSHDADLGVHLRITVHTGTYCVYQPDPRSKVDWIG